MSNRFKRERQFGRFGDVSHNGYDASMKVLGQRVERVCDDAVDPTIDPVGILNGFRNHPDFCAVVALFMRDAAESYCVAEANAMGMQSVVSAEEVAEMHNEKLVAPIQRFYTQEQLEDAVEMNRKRGASWYAVYHSGKSLWRLVMSGTFVRFRTFGNNHPSGWDTEGQDWLEQEWPAGVYLVDLKPVREFRPQVAAGRLIKPRDTAEEKPAIQRGYVPIPAAILYELLFAFRSRNVVPSSKLQCPMLVAHTDMPYEVAATPLGIYAGPCTQSSVIPTTYGEYRMARPMLPGTVTGFCLQGEPGTHVAKGRTTMALPEHFEFKVNPGSGNEAGLVFGDGIRISMAPWDSSLLGTWWDVSFASEQGRRLAEGVYTKATRFGDNGTARLECSGSGAGHNSLTGAFEVLEMIVGRDNRLLAFAADFVQYGQGPRLKEAGSIRYNSHLKLNTNPSDCLFTKEFATH